MTVKYSAYPLSEEQANPEVISHVSLTFTQYKKIAWQEETLAKSYAVV